MQKWINILAIAYLAVAPGMDVGRLIHSINLCRFADPVGHNQVVEHTHHCGQNHAPKPEPEPQDECPHMHNVAMHATAMPVVQMQPVEMAALPTLNPPVLELQAPVGACTVTDDDARPPPGPPLFGTIILLV